jgi:hypothetical protein
MTSALLPPPQHYLPPPPYDIPNLPPGVNVPPPQIAGGVGTAGTPPGPFNPATMPPLNSAPYQSPPRDMGMMDSFGAPAAKNPVDDHMSKQYSVEPQPDGTLVLMVHGAPGEKPIIAKVLSAPKRTLNQMQKANIG